MDISNITRLSWDQFRCISANIFYTEPGGKREHSRARLKWFDGVVEVLSIVYYRNWRTMAENRNDCDDDCLLRTKS